MSDLISKSALIEEVQKCFVNGCIHRNDLAEILANLPTVEANPVVHGEWEDVGDSMGDLCFRCSNCKEEFSCEIDMNSFAKFCPNCGADMRKKVK